ncbi:hypothetical protein BU23DRAFT_67657 [Bimuria novae-zelandiae CBS 107.79]|uniref:Uncharacterized protein n=1 Tax=Bimuria novae-zelandiae CBS 107.79 TaxID=1447943 RepID=A0A6A5VF42_9PLEO|nr:hypothetical protein BU23DRAFT_67657 [Bimuria novae-zelandiae CBS 107.79]
MPVPDIDRALSPYIKSREEALRIRRTLSKYLSASLRPVNAATQNQHLNHEVPQGLAAAGTNPPGLKGTRGTYLDAIRSHKAAQTKLARLQSSLDELQQRHVIESPVNDAQQNDEVMQSYITLLRQRRRFTELEIVHRSLEGLLNVNPVEGLQDIRDMVKNTIGEQPSLPAERLEALANDEANDSSMLKLKREVLEARSRMERARATRSELHSASRDVPGLDVQVYALARAREEMVEWMQSELAKLEEESGFLEDASPVKRPVPIASEQDLASSESQIQDRYTQYTTSRLAAIEKYQSFQRSPAMGSAQTDNNADDAGSTAQNVGKPGSKVHISALLPQLPHLTRNHTNERLMLLQAVYLQTQLSTADAEISDSIARLADESHILPSGSRGVEPWGRTVVDLDARNAKSVKERLQKSRSEITNTTTIVDLCSLQSKVLDSN